MRKAQVKWYSHLSHEKSMLQENTEAVLVLLRGFGEFWLNAMHSGKNLWIREFVLTYVFDILSFNTCRGLIYFLHLICYFSLQEYFSLFVVT